MKAVINWFDAKANPIAVKEIYQGFRSRASLFGCGVALAVSLFSFMAIAFTIDTGDDSSGFNLFITLLVVMAMQGLLVIPNAAGNQLREEIVTHTIDLMLITHLSPWQMISGRFQAAMIKLLLLFSYVAPFMATALLLGGIGALQIIYSLMALFFATLLVSAANLLVNSIIVVNSKLKIWAQLGQTLIFFGTIMLAGAFLISLLSGVRGSMMFDDLLGISILAAMALVATLLLLRLSADLLTPAGIRRFNPSKIYIFLVVVPITLIPALGSIFGYSIDKAIVMITPVMTLMVLGSLCLLWCGFDNHLPPKKGLGFFFSDGFFLTCAFCAVIALSVGGVLAIEDRDSEPLILAASNVVMFIYIAGVARLIRRLIRLGSSVVAYIIILICLVALNILGYFVVTNGIYSYNISSLVQVFFLPRTTTHIATTESIGYLFAVPLLIGILCGFLGRSSRKKL